METAVGNRTGERSMRSTTTWMVKHRQTLPYHSHISPINFNTAHRRKTSAMYFCIHVLLTTTKRYYTRATHVSRGKIDRKKIWWTAQGDDKMYKFDKCHIEWTILLKLTKYGPSIYQFGAFQLTFNTFCLLLHLYSHFFTSDKCFALGYTIVLDLNGLLVRTPICILDLVSIWLFVILSPTTIWCI